MSLAATNKLFVKMNMPSLGGNPGKCFLISAMNMLTLMSLGTRNFFLSMAGVTVSLSCFSTITGTRSGYFERILEATSNRLSKEYSCLKLEFCVSGVAIQ